jgi:tRNA/rRNA methyltransferase
MIEPDATSIILVEPLHPGNIGSAARAMKNMGFRRLRLVNPTGPFSSEARRMASGALDVLESAEVFQSLAEAVADLHVTAGLTARTGKGRIRRLDPQGLVRHLHTYPAEARLGIVFGREDRGLTNEELDLCNLLVTIPTAPEHASLNVAQAVLVVCYEYLKQANEQAETKVRKSLPAPSEELEALYRHGREVLLRIGFLHESNPDRILRVLRRIFGRIGLESREVSILRGILRQMDWYARISRSGPGKSG